MTIQEDLEHQEKMSFLIEQSEYGKFALLKPSLQKDGDQWTCLYGKDLQSGIAGFGKSPHEAIIDWNKQWFKPIINTPTK